jgi:hypothetical protein
MTTLLSSALPSAGQRTFTIEDWWMTALDGRMIPFGDEAYSLMVVGVHRGADDDVWVQLAPLDQADRRMLRTDRGVTLHCRAADSTADVLRALRSHLTAHGVQHGGHVEVVRK